MSREPVDKLLDAVDWQPLIGPAPQDHDGIPWATHRGIFEIAGLKLRVYQLSDGRRIIDADDLHDFLSGKKV